MRALKGAAIVITLEIMAWILWKPAIKPGIEWVFTRVEVETHPDCKPRYWSTRNGVRTEGTWATEANMAALNEQLSMDYPGGPLGNPEAFGRKVNG